MERLREVFTAVGEKVAGHPGVTLAVAAVLVFVAVAGAANIASVTGNDAFVSENPTLNTYQESFDRKTVAVLVDGEVTDPSTLRAVDRFDRRVSGVENVETVVTPADRVRAAYARVPGSSARIRDVVDASETTIISVVLEPDISQGEQSAVFETTVEAKEWASFPAGVDVVVTGQPAFTSQLNELIGQSTSQLLGLAVGLMIVALFFLFRGVRLRLLPIVAVFVGVIYTFGAMGYTGVPN